MKKWIVRLALFYGLFYASAVVVGLGVGTWYHIQYGPEAMDKLMEAFHVL